MALFDHSPRLLLPTSPTASAASAHSPSASCSSHLQLPHFWQARTHSPATTTPMGFPLGLFASSPSSTLAPPTSNKPLTGNKRTPSVPSSIDIPSAKRPRTLNIPISVSSTASTTASATLTGSSTTNATHSSHHVSTQPLLGLTSPQQQPQTQPPSPVLVPVPVSVPVTPLSLAEQSASAGDVSSPLSPSMPPMPPTTRSLRRRSSRRRKSLNSGGRGGRGGGSGGKSSGGGNGDDGGGGGGDGGNEKKKSVVDVEKVKDLSELPGFSGSREDDEVGERMRDMDEDEDDVQDEIDLATGESDDFRASVPKVLVKEHQARQRRLARKAELARITRRRHKEYVHNLEKENAALKEENGTLRREKGETQTALSALTNPNQFHPTGESVASILSSVIAPRLCTLDIAELIASQKVTTDLLVQMNNLLLKMSERVCSRPEMSVAAAVGVTAGSGHHGHNDDGGDEFKEDLLLDDPSGGTGGDTPLLYEEDEHGRESGQVGSEYSSL